MAGAGKNRRHSGRKRHRLRAIVQVALAIAVAGIVCWRFFLRPRPYNVILITMDGVRADRLGCYGHTKAKTPALDRLAEKGVLFENAYSSVPLTVPSHATIMTGLLPPEHGSHLNSQVELPDSVLSLAHILARRHYRTAAFVAAPLLGMGHGPARGFDLCSAGPTNGAPRAQDLLTYRSGEAVVQDARAWLAELQTGPFFCWVNLGDPCRLVSALARDVEGLDASVYDAFVGDADRAVGRILNLVQERGLEDNTVVVVAGSHGVSLGGEHGEPWPFHGFMLYDATLHVPLTFSGPGIRAGRRVEANVSLADIAPTLQEWLRIRGEDAGAGRSLAAVLGSKRASPPQRAVYAETHLPTRYRWSPQWCLIAGRQKYIRTPRAELYDRANDSAETQNLAERRPRDVRALEERLVSLEEFLEPHEGVQPGPMVDERRWLQSMGYVGRNYEGEYRDISAISLPDIKDKAHVVTELHRAERLSSSGNHARGEQVLRRVVKDYPGSCRAMGVLAHCLGQLERFDEAMSMAREALAFAEPGSEHAAHLALASIHAAQGRDHESWDAMAMAAGAMTAPDYRAALIDLRGVTGDLTSTNELGARAVTPR